MFNTRFCYLAGTGQATIELAKRFKQVIGMDPSPAQLSQTPQLGNVEVREGPAEATGIPSCSVDLLTIAEALHWWELSGPFFRWMRFEVFARNESNNGNNRRISNKNNNFIKEI